MKLLRIASVRPVVLGLCVIALLPCGAAAQQVGGGVKAGITFGDVPNADQMFEAGATTGQRIGFAAGGFVMVRFPNGFAVQPEVLYTQKGVKLESGGSTAKIKTDFLDIPVLARYTFGKGVRVYVFAGPSFDFKLSAKITSDLPTSSEEDISSDVKGFEFALVFGGGLELGPILVEGRWSEGLTNLDNAPSAGSPSLKTRTFLILGGVRF